MGLCVGIPYGCGFIDVLPCIDQVISMHYSPMEKMPLLEIITTAQVSKETFCVYVYLGVCGVSFFLNSAFVFYFLPYPYRHKLFILLQVANSQLANLICDICSLHRHLEHFLLCVLVYLFNTTIIVL